jgi:hypothetical protein
VSIPCGIGGPDFPQRFLACRRYRVGHQTPQRLGRQSCPCVLRTTVRRHTAAYITLGPHGHSAGHAQGSRSIGRTATETPVPLVPCRPRSDDPIDDQRPLRVRVKTLVSPTAPAPQILLPRLARVWPPECLCRVAGLSHVRLTAPARIPTRSPSPLVPAGTASPGGPVCRRFAARLGLRHQAVGA